MPEFPRGGWVPVFEDGVCVRMEWWLESYVKPSVRECRNGLPITGKGNWRVAGQAEGTDE